MTLSEPTKPERDSWTISAVRVPTRFIGCLGIGIIAIAIFFFWWILFKS